MIYRNTANLCVSFIVYYGIGYGLSIEADGGIFGSGKTNSYDFKEIDYTKLIALFGFCLISV